MEMFLALLMTSRARRIVYVDDLLAVGNKKILEVSFKHLQTVWDIATSEYQLDSQKMWNLFAV
eukprot:1447303-Amphidinium_carterae.1